MKNFVAKSVFEEKLSELEKELVILEEVIANKRTVNKIELQLEEEVVKIDRKLDDIISRIETHSQANGKNQSRHSLASCIPSVANI